MDQLGAAAIQAQNTSWGSRLRSRTTVEDVPEEGKEDVEINPELAASDQWHDTDDEYDEDFWNEYVNEIMAAEEEMNGLSAWDQLRVEFEAENCPMCMLSLCHWYYASKLC